MGECDTDGKLMYVECFLLKPSGPVGIQGGART